MKKKIVFLSVVLSLLGSTDARLVGSLLKDLGNKFAAQGQGLLNRELEGLTVLLNRPYNHLIGITAHNAFSSTAYGYTLNPQQNSSIADQMSKQFVRGLMLDVYQVGSGVNLCHTKCGGVKMGLQRAAAAKGEPLQVRFKEITDWLTGAIGPETDSKGEVVPRLAQAQSAIAAASQFSGPEGAMALLAAQPQSGGETIRVLRYIAKTPPILTIFFEDYVSGEGDRNDNGASIDKLLEETGLSNYVLRPSDWDPVAKGGWPSLAWMIKNNKVVVLFTDATQVMSKYVYPQWVHMVETTYSQMEPKEVCKERKGGAPKGGSDNQRSRPRYLYLLNRFPKFNLKVTGIGGGDVNFDQENRKNIDAVNYCFDYGLEPGEFAKNRYPNMIAIDQVNKGDTFGTAITPIWNNYEQQIRSIIAQQRAAGALASVGVGSVEQDDRFKEGGIFDLPMFRKLQAPLPAGVEPVAGKDANAVCVQALFDVFRDNWGSGYYNKATGICQSPKALAGVCDQPGTIQQEINGVNVVMCPEEPALFSEEAKECDRLLKDRYPDPIMKVDTPFGRQIEILVGPKVQRYNPNTDQCQSPKALANQCAQPGTKIQAINGIEVVTCPEE